MTHIQQVAVKMVTEQIIAMFTNNVINNCGIEHFEGWCEDGDVFAEHPAYEAECIALMKRVAPLVDKLTYNHLNFGF